MRLEATSGNVGQSVDSPVPELVRRFLRPFYRGMRSKEAAEEIEETLRTGWLGPMGRLILEDDVLKILRSSLENRRGLVANVERVGAEEYGRRWAELFTTAHDTARRLAEAREIIAALEKAIEVIEAFLASNPVLWKSEKRSEVQTAILNRVEELVRTTPSSVVVFDLDDCLFSASTRQVKIWREYGELHGIEALKQIRPSDITSWDLKTVMVTNLGLSETWFDGHFNELRAFWSERFFSNQYIVHDAPLTGAAKYIRALHATGAHIVYLSGRSEEEMGEGTKNVLRRNGFPLDEERTTLILKNISNKAIWKAGMPDEERIRAQWEADVRFKKEAIERIRKTGTVVASFDNEDANVNQYYDEYHSGGVGLAVRVDTYQAKVEELLKGVVVIQGFLR